MAIIRTKIFPVEGQSPIVLQGVPQSIELVGDITGDKGTNEVWEDTKRIEDFEVKITTLDEYSTGVPHKVVKRVDTLDTTSKTWTEGTRETYEAQEEEFTLNYKGHERDFEVKIDSEESKAFIKYRWGRNDAHDLTVEKDITITERPTPVEPEEGGGGSEELKPMMFMGKEGTGDDTWLYFAVLKEYLFDDDEYGKCFKIMNGASTTYSSCDTLQSCEGCPYMDECKYTDFLKPFLNSHPEYDGVCMGDGLWFPITLYDPKTEKPVYTALTEMPEEGGDSDDGDA